MSDLHANWHAFQACLAHARQQGAAQFAFLGDLVGYGGHPAEVVDEVMALAAQGVPVVRGNHDELAVHPPAKVHLLGEIGAEWTHRQLSASALRFLSDLPLTQTRESALLVHADAEAPERWRYVDSVQAAAASLKAATHLPGVRHVFSGHVHHQMLYFQDPRGELMMFKPMAGVPIAVPPQQRWLATVGSVGQPRDNDPRAMYAIFDQQAHTLTFQRVAYDHASAANAVRATGAMPETFAQRLSEGR